MNPAQGRMYKTLTPIPGVREATGVTPNPFHQHVSVKRISCLEIQVHKRLDFKIKASLTKNTSYSVREAFIPVWGPVRVKYTLSPLFLKGGAVRV